MCNNLQVENKVCEELTIHNCVTIKVLVRTFKSTNRSNLKGGDCWHVF
jgi:hypothetical protein